MLEYRRIRYQGALGHASILAMAYFTGRRGYEGGGGGLPVVRNGLSVIGIRSGATTGKEGGVQSAPLLLKSPFYATNQANGNILAWDACR